MAVKKIEIRPKGTGDYADVLYPMTSDDMVQVADANNHFTATKLNGVLDELFLNADNGQRSIANVVGSPTVAGDTYTKISNDITNAKNTMGTNLTAKGVAATSADTLAQLATKIGQIVTAPKTPGDNVQVGGIISAVSTTSTVYESAGKSITFGVSGTYRLKFGLKSFHASWDAYGRFFNVTTGTYIGTERTTRSTASYVVFTEDLAISAGHKIDLHFKTANASYNAYVDNLIVATAEPSLFLVQ